MSYRSIEYGHISNPAVSIIFHRADLYLSDVYSMFYLPLKGRRRGGGCNFTIVLTLMCVIDGIAGDIYPKRSVIKKDNNRFRKLVREKLFWGDKKHGWMDKNIAAKELYLGFRNPLVHELGRDRPQNKPQLEEPVIGPWGPVPSELRDIDRIDRLKEWDPAWPIMTIQRREGGGQAIKLTASGLYWAVKRMVAEFAKTSN